MKENEWMGTLKKRFRIQMLTSPGCFSDFHPMTHPTTLVKDKQCR